jgi:hypothetical protein
MLMEGMYPGTQLIGRAIRFSTVSFVTMAFLGIIRTDLSVLSINMVKISLFEVFHALKLFVMRCFNPVLIPGHTSPSVYVSTGMILDPRNKLNASCRHMAFRMFFAIVVNRALKAPSCK